MLMERNIFNWFENNFPLSILFGARWEHHGSVLKINLSLQVTIAESQLRKNHALRMKPILVLCSNLQISYEVHRTQAAKKWIAPYVRYAVTIFYAYCYALWTHVNFFFSQRHNGRESYKRWGLVIKLKTYKYDEIERMNILS